MKGSKFIMSKSQDIINRMLNGEVTAIKLGLDSNDTVLRINAIIHSTTFKINDKYIIEKIESLTEDNNYLRICAFTVGEFATASLHIRGIKKYSGDNISIKRLIESQFNF